MMKKSIEYHIGRDAIEKFNHFIGKKKLDDFLLLTDQNEYKVLGRRVQKSIQRLKKNLEVIILDGNPVKADEEYIVRVFKRLGDKKRMFVSVGSGTITDITRFVAFRTRSDFISLPTAPSMDGYAASGSSLTLEGLKQTVYSRPPLAIFADLDVLCKAPRPMISAGFGDTFGKYSALADWKLANLLWGEKIDFSIAGRVAKSLDTCSKLVENLDELWEENIRALMEALIEVGICMYLAGTTRPASGAEHSLSHFWEMKLMREGRPVNFHGTKVGFAELLISKQYERLRKISKDEAVHLIKSTSKPILVQEKVYILNSYGKQAEQVLTLQDRFLNISEMEFNKKQSEILDKWDEIQEIANSVPPPEKISDLLTKVGLPTNPDLINLNEKDIEQALLFAHYARNAFTILKLFKFIGVDPLQDCVEQ